MNRVAKNVFKFNPLTHQNKYNLYLHEYQAYEILKKYNVPLVPVSFLLYRVSEQALLKMPTLSQTDWCHKPQSQKLLLMSSSRHKSTPVAEVKEHSKKLVSKAVSKLRQNPHKFSTTLKECWVKLL